MSGFSDVEIGALPFLAKPFTATRLLERSATCSRQSARETWKRGQSRGVDRPQVDSTGYPANTRSARGMVPAQIKPVGRDSPGEE